MAGWLLVQGVRPLLMSKMAGRLMVVREVVGDVALD